MVELLVVIAIIAILAALLLPVLTRAKVAAQKASCINNLHQIGIANHLYLNEYRRYPPFGPSENYHREGFWDYQLLIIANNGNTNNTKLFKCPANKDFDRGQMPMSEKSHRQSLAWTTEDTWTSQDEWNNMLPNASYAYNGAGTATNAEETSPALGLGNQWWFVSYGISYDPPLNEDAVIKPADMILTCDFNLVESDDDLDGDLHPNMAFISVSKRHSDGSVIAFCDGHVEYGKIAHWVNSSETARRRWNHDNQSH